MEDYIEGEEEFEPNDKLAQAAARFKEETKKTGFRLLDKWIEDSEKKYDVVVRVKQEFNVVRACYRVDKENHDKIMTACTLGGIGFIIFDTLSKERIIIASDTIERIIITE